MKIIPAIDIRNGKCVRLYQGDYSREIIYNDDPVLVAKEWERQGAQALHIVDLDGAKEGKQINFEIIKKIVSSTRLPVQIGGGIRNSASIYRYIENGVQNVIVGTIALENMRTFSNILSTFSDKIIVALDSNGNILMKNGWKDKSKEELMETVKKLDSMGVMKIIYTDITRDGTLTEPNYKAIERIINCTKMEIIVAGGVSSIEQLITLKDIGVDGIILGKALYEGKISIEEANSLC